MQPGIYDYSKLRGLIRERKRTQEEIAVAVGLNPSILSQKLCGKGLFKQTEISAICNVLQIRPEDISVYFFAN